MQKKTIILLGSTGMAGHVLYHYLESTQKYNLIDVSFRKKLTENTIVLDIRDKAALEELLIKVKPDYIINCIGILIKGSADTENAIYINAYFPHLLKKIGDQIGAKVIHLSTDCVFSGEKGSYKEDSFRDADDVYGRSKALGEIDDINHLTIRTSIIGPEIKKNGEGLFHWFIRIRQQNEVVGYTNAIWTGVTTLVLAKAIESHLSGESASGIVHLTNGKRITKFELLNLFNSIWSKNNIIKEGIGKKNVDKSLTKSHTFKYDVPSYEAMLREQFLWMETHRKLYSLYTS